jgi:hypothetical protein
MYFHRLLAKPEQSRLFQIPYISLNKGFFTNTFAVEAFNLDTADGKQSDNNCILRSVLWARSFALRLVKQYDLCFGLFHSELVNNKKYSFQRITS